MADDRVGQQFGNYRLVHLLGEGGFAEVYLGEHIHMASQVAVKLLHTKLITSEQEEFLEEARTIAALDHPSIVRVLDCGIERGEPFLIMQYAPNGTLRQRYPKGTRMPSSIILEYTCQVAEALQYAHDRKLIHRDVKPENMLIGSNDELLLSDFGIALISSSSSSQSTKAATGTVSYMAPEQVLGKPRIASDQYALGIVVYEWLCGELPFRGSFSEMCAQHLYAPPPSLIAKVSTISPDTEAVVMKALAKEPSERFANIQDFANALQGSYERTSPVLSAIKTVNVSSEGVAPDSSESENPALAATVLPDASKPVDAAAPLAEMALSDPLNDDVPCVATDPPASTPDTASIDMSKITLHAITMGEANEKTDEPGNALSPTEPVPLVSSLSSKVSGGKSGKNLFIIVGTLLVLLLMIFPLLLHYNLLLPTSSKQNQGVAQITRESKKVASQNTPTQVHTGQQPAPQPTSGQPAPQPTSGQTPSQPPNSQPPNSQPPNSQPPNSQPPNSQPQPPQPTQPQAPQPTLRSLTSTVGLGLNVNSTGYQAATYATGYIEIANTTFTCASAGASLYNTPIVLLNGVCFNLINTYYLVYARASSVGTAGNYAVGRTFNCGTCYGYIYSGFNNGLNAYYYVLQSDINNAVSQLENSATTQAENDLNSQMNSNEHMVASPQCTSAWQSNHSAGDIVATFSVAVATRCVVTVST